MCALHFPVGRLLSSRLLSPISVFPVIQHRQIFHESKKPTRIIKKFKEGDTKWKVFKEECEKLKDECKKTLRADHVTDTLAPKHDDFELVYQFNSQEAMDKWVVSTDSDSGVGHSSAELILGQNKTAIFKGNINTEAPKDGIVTKTGFANIQALAREEKSFFRQQPAHWTRYTHLVLKVRGDGRPYNVVLGMHREYDVQWNDQYVYPLYTRGGPYWQISKIPFSKFFLSYKGRIPDKQAYIDLQNVLTVGFTLADGVDGPFQLELDWMGLVYDQTHNDTFVYESYEQNQYFLT